MTTSWRAKWLVHILAFGYLAAQYTPCLAQRGAGNLTGLITDQTGAAIPEAAVTLSITAKGLTLSTVTNTAGLYYFTDLTPDVYSLSVQKAGFNKAVLTDVRVFVGETMTQNAQLQVGEITQSVEVTAAAPLLHQASSEIGTVIERKTLTEIPLNGRNFLQLNLLSAGATRSKNSNTFDAVQIDPTAQSFNVNGQRGDYNLFLLDGVTIKEYQHGSNTFAPSVDAVQEFETTTSNYAAAFGAEAGAQVNLVTRSGTNELHGSVYEFLRNNALDARNFFEGESEAPHFRRNQFGGTVGGPVVIPRYNGKDKTFFFASYEGFRERKGIPLLANLPPPGQLRGDLSDLVTPDKPLIDPSTGQPFPGNRIPQDRMPANLLSFLENGIGQGPWLPVPNINRPGFNYFADSLRTFSYDQVLFRVDQKVGQKGFLYGRYALHDADLTNPNVNRNFNYVQVNRAQSVGVRFTWAFKPNLISEYNFGYSRFHQDEVENFGLQFQHDITNEILKIRGLSTIPDTWGAPQWEVSGYGNLGAGYAAPRRWLPANFEGRPIFTWNRGRHNMKFGGDVIRFLDTFQEIITPNGQLSFDGRFSGYPLGDFLLGLPAASFFSRELFNPQQRYTQIAGYFQDDWKVTPNLTLNLGIRYEWSGVPYSSNRSFANGYLGPNNAAPQIVVSEGAKGITYKDVTYDLLTIAPYVTATSVGLPDSLVFSAKRDFGPRFGFAYTIPHLRNTVLRGGYGIFYQRDTENRFVDLALNPPFVGIYTQAFTQDNISQFNWFEPLGGTSVGGLALFAIDPYLRNGQIQAWHFSLERTFAKTLFAASYVGNTSRHLTNLELLNQARPGPGPLEPRKRWPGGGTLYYMNNNGSANYNSFQFKVQRPFAQGFMLLLGYTFSKTIDDSGGTFVGEGARGFTSQDAYNRHADRGLAAQDVRHRFVASYIYELPFGRGKPFLNQGHMANALLGGWQLNGVTTFQAGNPVFITQVCNRANTDSGAQRPDLAGNPKLSSGRPSGELVNEFFSTNAFVNVCPGPEGPFTFGNAGRNIVIGPGINLWDFGLYKNMGFRGENVRLQFRAEFFNLFNHPIFGQPGNTVGTPQFGKIGNTAIDSREIQFGLKLNF